jgi:hypothetical protein
MDVACRNRVPLGGRFLISLVASTIGKVKTIRLHSSALSPELQAALPCFLIVRSARRPWSK